MEFLTTNSISSIRMCDNGDAEQILKLIQNTNEEVSSRSKGRVNWDLEKLEDDLCKNHVVWYCLEVEQDEEDVLIVVARLSYSIDTSSKIAIVDSIFFSDGLYSASACISLLKSFLTQLETIAFHMKAASMSIEAESDHSTFLSLLENAGYVESGGYLDDVAQCMVMKYMRALSDSASNLDVLDVQAVSAEEEDQLEILASADDAMASLMPDLFAALHKEYNATGDK